MTSRSRPNRRRFLNITAAVAGLALLPRGSAPAPATFETWRGTALGARASIRLAHSDPGFARALIGRARAEIDRLEQVFSLYRADSAISRLNRRGVLHAPPLDLVRLLAAARRYSELTHGAFDVTVQPLWTFYAEHFGREGAMGNGPDPEALAAVLARIDHRAVSVDPARIAFEKPDMAITLNGIAQGYITDRIADLFRRDGLGAALIDLGELRALGRHPEGRPWSVGLEDPRQRARILETLELGNAALATSAGHGTRFDAAGEHHHLFDPGTGRSTRRYLSLSVSAPSATEADALSTGLFHLDQDRLAALVGQRRGVSAMAVLAGGELRAWPA
jgi:thiamine biosynthesis lipoprotein